MAAVMLEAARTARSEAGRLRGESETLRLALRESAAHSLQERRKAQAAIDRICVQRDTPLPSPWSGLGWALWDEKLDQTLVPVA